jgi:hypothetical protein
MKLDDWQKQVLATKGNICLRSGRQVGKSTIISIKAGDYAVKNKKKKILIIASVERQAQLLHEKVLSYIMDKYPKAIKKGKERPTKSKIHLVNGSVIYCLPTGLSGHGIRGYTIDLLIADEAAFIPEEVWTAVTPMLAVTKGDIILLSTPFGKGGYFYRCFNDKSFSSFHVTSEECVRADKEFLKREKERLSKLEYAQEYLGEFVDELRQFFPTELIKRVCTLNPKERIPILSLTSLGVDVARMGADDSDLVSVELVGDKIFQIDQQTFKKVYTTDTARAIIEKDTIFKYNKIFVDDGGLGVAVVDYLLDHDQTKRKVVAINNSARSIDFKRKKGKRLLKEDLYNNLLKLMETDKIVLFNDEDLKHSLKSIQAEYRDGNLKIFGNYTHKTEALIRACWITKHKSLNIWIA